MGLEAVVLGGVLVGYEEKGTNRDIVRNKREQR